MTAVGNNIKWYDASTGGSLLASSTSLVNGNHYYASQSSVLGCESSTRLDVTVIITPLPTASISYPSSPFYTSVSTPQSVTFSGTTGGTYTASPVGLSINSLTGDITPSSSTLGTYTVTYTIAASGGCPTVIATTQVIITTVPTTTTFTGTGNWNVSTYWDHGVPASTTNAFIAGNCTLTTTGTCKNLTINPNGYLTVNSGQALTVNGQFTIKSSAIGTGSYINNGNVNYSLTPMVERYISQNAWHYITSPVQGALSGMWTDLYLKDYNEAINTFNPLITSVTVPLTVGKGFALWSSTSTTGNVTRTYTGNLNEGDHILPLQWSGSTRGNNLIGNMFTSAITADINNWTKTNVDNSLWVWNPSIGNYQTWNGTTGTLSGGGIIPASQGFLVKANNSGASITIMQSKRVQSAVAYYKDATDNTLSINVAGNTYSDGLVVSFNSDATNFYDPDYDIEKMYGLPEAPQIATIWNGDTLSVNEIPEISEYSIMPMIFKCTASGTYTLTANGASSFNIDLPISLQDLVANQTIDLRQQQVYQFNHVYNPSVTTPRFNLIFGENLTGIAEHNGDLNIYAYDHKIFIDNPTLINIVQIIVYNSFGQMVKVINSPKSVNRIEINTNFAVGTYFVETIDDNGVNTIRKIIIQ